MLLVNEKVARVNRVVWALLHLSLHLCLLLSYQGGATLELLPLTVLAQFEQAGQAQLLLVGRQPLQFHHELERLYIVGLGEIYAVVHR